MRPGIVTEPLETEDRDAISAGHEEPMRNLIEANEGLQSRCQTKIASPAYTHDELVQMRRAFADTAQNAVSLDVIVAVRRQQDALPQALLTNREAADSQPTSGTTTRFRSDLPDDRDLDYSDRNWWPG